MEIECCSLLVRPRSSLLTAKTSLYSWRSKRNEFFSPTVRPCPHLCTMLHKSSLTEPSLSVECAARVYGEVQHPPPPPPPPPPPIGFWGRIFVFWHLKSNTKLQWYTTYWWGGEGGGEGQSFLYPGIIASTYLSV